MQFVPQLGFLGSGSDYTAFVDHLGVPALNVSFGGRYGVYHSIFDDFFWMEKLCDPEFVLHSTSAKLYTLIMIRAASSEVVPLTFTPYAEALREHVDELRRLVARKERASGKPFEFEGLADLISAVRKFDEQARSLDLATANLAHRGDVPIATLQQANDALTQVERGFLLEAGLPARAWFKHSIYVAGHHHRLRELASAGCSSGDRGERPQEARRGGPGPCASDRCRHRSDEDRPASRGTGRLIG